MSLPGARQLFRVLGSAPVLPYDAEVEWLESTGTQWIDTGVYGRDGLLIECGYRLSDIDNHNYVVYSRYNAASFIALSHSTTTGLAFAANTAVANFVDLLNTKWHCVTIDTTSYNKKAVCDGVTIKTWDSANSNVSTNPIHLFCNHSVTYFSRASISSFKVTDTATNQVIQDLIPVRKNGVGYMYDKVTGTLLANQGTGAFLYGKDKNPLYAAEVDYIEATGTQYIDTGVKSRDGLLVSVRVMQVTLGSSSSPALYIFRGVGSGSRAAFGCYYSDVTLRAALNGTTFYEAGGPPEIGIWKVIDLCTTPNAKYVKIDGINVLEEQFALDGVSKSDMLLLSSLGAHFNPGARVSSFKVTDTATNQIIQDLIPVRVLRNGKFVGAMYDRVTNTVLENAGTGDLLVGRDKEYDYEVEYIQKDCSVPWVDANGAEIEGYFDLNRYADDDETLGTMRPLEATWSFEPLSVGLAYALRRQNGFYARGCIKFNGSDDYAFTPLNTFHTGISGNLAVMHTQRMEYSGGSINGYMDGTLVVDVAVSGGTKFTNARLMASGKTTEGQHYSGKMRIAKAKIGSDVYLIPVVKGNAVGFYNMVDGHLFLEEQECLSAGPRV